MKRVMKIFIGVLLILFSSNLFGQIDSSQVNNSPYSVIYNHLYYLQNENYNPGRAALSLPSNVEDEANLAVKLKQILDGKGMFVDLNRLPRNINYIDSISEESIYFISRSEPLIYVEKINGSWFYSRTTVESIPEMHKHLYPFGTQFITYFQAPVWQINVLGIKIWKWLGLGLLLFLGSLIFYLFNKVSQGIFTNIVKRRLEITELVQKTLLKASRIVGLIIATRFMLYFIPMFQLSPRLNSLIIKGLAILSIFFIILLVKNISTIIFSYFDKLAKKTENTLDDQLLPVLQKLVTIIIWAFGIIYILDSLNVNVTALLAGISIGGLALALAAQDTVKNFFGSIMIFLDRPFQIGDWIHFNGVDGTVEEVGVRSTRIRTFANSLTYVPNAMLADTVVDNMGLRVYRRFKTDIGITYDTKPEIIEKFVEGIRAIIRLHPTSRKDYFEVHLNSFGSSSINILIYMFFQAPSWTDELRGRHEILYAIIKLAHSLGVRFAFPTQTIHIEEMASPGISNTPSPQQPKEAGENLINVMNEIAEYFKTDRESKDKIKPIGGE